MASAHDTDDSRTQTDQSLRAERQRSDEELLARSTALAEDSEDVIERARERAREVLELARAREDRQLDASGVKGRAREAVQQERSAADATVAGERHVADAQRLDERERRRASMVQLLALERSATDRTLAEERRVADTSVVAREDLLAIVAHDLRNMLSTVLINASVILMAKELRSAVAPAVHLQRVGAQMEQLLEDLLDFSSFEAGKLTLAMSDVDVVSIVKDVVAIHEQAAKVRSLTLTMKTGVPALTIHADGRRLTRLLMNLIANAMKFTPAGGRVDVRVSRIADECEIAVSDTGIGIAKEHLSAIFERFQQVGDEPRRATGVGLGLYICRLIADAHGGRIWAESEPSLGSTFRLRLPINGRS